MNEVTPNSLATIRLKIRLRISARTILHNLLLTTLVFSTEKTVAQSPQLKLPVRSTSNLSWKVDYDSPAHINKDTYAIDLNLVNGGSSDHGQPVLAAGNGTVIIPNPNFSSNGVGYGYWVLVDHGNNYVTVYAHLDAVIVRHGQPVIQGQVLGTVGDSGTSGQYHLHFALWRNDQPVQLNTVENFTFGDQYITSTNQMARPVAISEGTNSPWGDYNSTMAREISNRFHVFKSELGWPSTDGSGELLHEWTSAPDAINWKWPGFHIQNFNGGSWGPSALVYNYTVHRALTLHGGFWNVFRYGVGDNSESDPGSGFGPTIMVGGKELGFPETDEFQDGGNVVQIFSNGMMVWDGTEVHLFTKPTEQTAGRYVYTTSDDGPQILLPKTTQIFKRSADIYFTPIDDAYNYGVWESGKLITMLDIPSASSPEESPFEGAESTLSFTAENLTPGNQYFFQIVAVDANLRSVGYSNILEVLTNIVQPDVLVGRSLTHLVGEGVFNLSANQQSIQISSRRNINSGYFSYKNVGNISERFTVSATRRGKAHYVKFLASDTGGFRPVTAEVISGRFKPMMQAGDSRLIFARIGRSKSRKIRSSECRIYCTVSAEKDHEADRAMLRSRFR